MRIRQTIFMLLGASLFLFIFTACNPQKNKHTKPIIVLSILPQQFFADQIAQGKVETLCLVGQGQNPHNYEPRPSQMADLARAKIWITSGTDFEISLKPKILAQFKNLKIIDGTQGVQFRLLQEFEIEASSDTLSEENHESAEELSKGLALSHSEDDHHHDSNIDRHSWLGREPAKLMATYICEALTEIDPENSEFFRTNCANLVQAIDETFDTLKKDLLFLKDTSVLVYHPSFGYFLDEFSIHQIAIESGGKEPSTRELLAIIEQAKKEAAPAIFVQAQFPVTAAQTVASQTKSKVISLDPLAYNWLENIRTMGEALKGAYELKKN